MDIVYFLDQAQNNTKQEFNEFWMDVIEELDDESTTLITEDEKCLSLNWEDGKLRFIRILNK